MRIHFSHLLNAATKVSSRSRLRRMPDDDRDVAAAAADRDREQASGCEFEVGLEGE